MPALMVVFVLPPCALSCTIVYTTPSRYFLPSLFFLHPASFSNAVNSSICLSVSLERFSQARPSSRTLLARKRAEHLQHAATRGLAAQPSIQNRDYYYYYYRAFAYRVRAATEARMEGDSENEGRGREEVKPFTRRVCRSACIFRRACSNAYTRARELIFRVLPLHVGSMQHARVPQSRDLTETRIGIGTRSLLFIHLSRLLVASFRIQAEVLLAGLLQSQTRPFRPVRIALANHGH